MLSSPEPSRARFASPDPLASSELCARGGGGHLRGSPSRIGAIMRSEEGLLRPIGPMACSTSSSRCHRGRRILQRRLRYRPGGRLHEPAELSQRCRHWRPLHAKSPRWERLAFPISLATRISPSGSFLGGSGGGGPARWSRRPGDPVRSRRNVGPSCPVRASHGGWCGCRPPGGRMSAGRPT